MRKFAIGAIPAITAAVTVLIYLRALGADTWINYFGLIIAGGAGAMIGVAINIVSFRR